MRPPHPWPCSQGCGLMGRVNSIHTGRHSFPCSQYPQFMELVEGSYTPLSLNWKGRGKRWEGTTTHSSILQPFSEEPPLTGTFVSPLSQHHMYFGSLLQVCWRVRQRWFPTQCAQIWTMNTILAILPHNTSHNTRMPASQMTPPRSLLQFTGLEIRRRWVLAANLVVRWKESGYTSLDNTQLGHLLEHYPVITRTLTSNN